MYNQKETFNTAIKILEEKGIAAKVNMTADEVIVEMGKYQREKAFNQLKEAMALKGVMTGNNFIICAQIEEADIVESVEVNGGYSKF
jgi:tRNA threonylcarbamoyladenosine modification (KEOPS) complex Cgi121 subunit